MYKVIQYQRYTCTEYICVRYNWQQAVLVLHDVQGHIEGDVVCLSAHRGEIAIVRTEMDEAFLEEVGDKFRGLVNGSKKPNLKLASQVNSKLLIKV